MKFLPKSDRAKQVMRNYFTLRYLCYQIKYLIPHFPDKVPFKRDLHNLLLVKKTHSNDSQIRRILDALRRNFIALLTFDSNFPYHCNCFAIKMFLPADNIYSFPQF